MRGRRPWGLFFCLFFLLGQGILLQASSMVRDYGQTRVERIYSNNGFKTDVSLDPVGSSLITTGEKNKAGPWTDRKETDTAGWRIPEISAEAWARLTPWDALRTRVGRKPVELVINIPAFRLYLFQQGRLVTSFPIAVGKATTPTPVGELQVINRVYRPTWYPQGRPPVPPGPENPLGEWWLGLSLPGYGIHGNNNPRSIGQAVSNGCIRMRNEDIAVLQELVKVGTPVHILYEPVWLDVNPPAPRLELFPDPYHRTSRVEALARLLAPIGEVLPLSPLALPLLVRVGKGRVELPWRVECYINNRSEPETGFIWQDQAYLPAAYLVGLFGWPLRWESRTGAVFLGEDLEPVPGLLVDGHIYLAESVLRGRVLAQKPQSKWEWENLRLRIDWLTAAGTGEKASPEGSGGTKRISKSPEEPGLFTLIE